MDNKMDIKNLKEFLIKIKRKRKYKFNIFATLIHLKWCDFQILDDGLICLVEI